MNPEYLQETFDKFTFRVPTDRLYTAEGVWVQLEAGDRIRVGVTDYLQQHSGDMAFANIKPAETALRAGQEFAELETMKINLGIAAPVSGTINAVNPALELTPEVINEDPYGAGWLALMAASDWEVDRARLLDASGYLSVMRSQIEEERRA